MHPLETSLMATIIDSVKKIRAQEYDDINLDLIKL